MVFSRDCSFYYFFLFISFILNIYHPSIYIQIFQCIICNHNQTCVSAYVCVCALVEKIECVKKNENSISLIVLKNNSSFLVKYAIMSSYVYMCIVCMAKKKIFLNKFSNAPKNNECYPEFIYFLLSTFDTYYVP